MIYLTAHRVLSPTSGAEGINAFRYSQGNYLWPGPPPAGIGEQLDEDPGVLVRQVVTVRPPGNRVRSFLDVVAPVDVNPDELNRAAEAIVAGEIPARFPTEWSHGRIWLRFGVERALAPFWRSELPALFDQAFSLLA